MLHQVRGGYDVDVDDDVDENQNSQRENNCSRTCNVTVLSMTLNDLREEGAD